MMIPFSFWGANPFAGKVYTTQYAEDFTGWFVEWAGKVYSSEFSDDLNGFLDPAWVGVVYNSELFDNFDSGW